MRPFDALTMPLDGIRLIEASAGTGKTFSLAGLYLRLLVEERLDLREILVMTFTRAATQELRERIRARLTRAARLAAEPAQADPDSAEDSFALALIERAAAEEPAALARRLAEAARRMDEATITTIHGFAQQAASENAFDSALPFDRGEQIDDRLVYPEVIGDYWRAQALGPAAVPAFIDAWPLPEDLARDLAPFWVRPHARLAGPPDSQIEARLQTLRAAWPAQAGAFGAAWRQCEGALRKNEALKQAIEACGGIEPALARLDQALRQGRELLPRWIGRAEAGQFLDTKKHAPRRAACLEQPLLAELRRAQPLAELAALRRARAWIAAAAAARKRARRQFSFADMIASLYEAVRAPATGERLAAALHQTWPWALVDEFQDTDPWQYEILRATYAGRERGGLLLIGDPKQAIYSFRGGDVHAYLAAARDAGERCYSLDASFRATPQLLQAIETLFRRPGEDAFLVDGIAYTPVRAGRDDQRELLLGEAVQPALSLWSLPGEPPNKGQAQQACRQACIGQISRLLHTPAQIRWREAGEPRERTLAPRDIAVLVNSNQEAGEMQAALAAAGIAAVCLHEDSVFGSDEALDLLHLLKAAANPTDEDLIRGALSGPLLGLRQADLIALRSDEATWQAQAARFLDAHEQWRERGVLAMLQGLIQAAAPRLLGWRDGERRLSNYLQLAELLAAAQRECFGMDGLLHWLHRARRDAAEPLYGEAALLRLESDQALVRISTVHKAKGLEYPVVLLPYAPWLGSAGQPDKPPYEYHADGHSLIDRIGNGDSAARSITERRAEALRLLYVALTRAALACYLPWGAVNGSQNSALASLLHRDLLPGEAWGASSSRKPLSPGQTQTALDKLQAAAGGSIRVLPLPPQATGTAPPPAPADAGAARSDLPARRQPWRVHSFSGLLRAAAPAHAAGRAQDEAQSEPLETAEATAEPLPELPGGTRFGEAVHELLELGPQDWPADATLSPAARQNLEQALRRHGIGGGRAQQALLQGTAGLLAAAWHTPLPGIGPLAQLPPACRIAEMEFHFQLGGSRYGALRDLLQQAGYAAGLPREREAELLRGLMHGFIDLTVEHDGRYYVIDYKTNYLGPTSGHYAPAALRQAIAAHHYDLQYLIYLTALHRLLGRRLPDYAPETHLGGARYLFLRGMSPQAGGRGIHADTPPPALIRQLDALLATAEAAA